MKIAEFDGATIAPENGAAARGEAMAALAGEHHELLTSNDAVALVSELEQGVAAGEISDPKLVAQIRTLARDQREALAFPTEEVEAWSRLTCEADAVWHKAKVADDWASFEPYIDRIVASLKRQAAYLDDTRDPYDVWLDQYERGMDSAAFDRFFGQVRETVVPLVQAIGERGEQPEAPFLTAHVNDATQRALSFDLMRLVGLNDADTCLAFTEHPFSEGFSVGDARVATHIYEDNLMSNVYSIIHEAGHAAYELGVDPAYARTCLEGGTSMGIHESQSRFFENTVGRSRAFMTPLLGLLRRHVPGVYNGVTEDELYRAVNIATPSLIRTEADELTYSLHIMVRYEIEKQLIGGTLAVKDVPETWNRLYKEYLGVDVPDDKHGCLQDSHWSGGSFGYFPSYALGSAYGAQMLRNMEKEIDVWGPVSRGDLSGVSGWLKERVHQFGGLLTPTEVVQNACGSFDPTVYTDYLANKYSQLYGLG